MNKDYCLLDEPWLPVRLVDGSNITLGLLAVFERSGEIAALAETAPPSLVAQYRLLLAITHRALCHSRGRWTNRDRGHWYREGLPVAEICDYLEHWRDRFWLFHPEHPFMQAAALSLVEETKNKLKPWTQIALASANGNAPVVFDHTYDSAPLPISPAQAVATLLGFLQFTPGGLVKALRDADKAGALVNTAAVIPVGATLAQTLCLSLHPAPTGHGSEDLPAWERTPLSIEELRSAPVLASGPNDRYTRQSRAVQLLRENDGKVRWLRFAAGRALGEDTSAPDPMASFRAGSNGLVRLTFTEGRALWRDLPALTPNPTGASQAATVVHYALALFDSDNGIYQPLLVAGVASEKAKLLRWRAEQIVLPAALLADADKALYLRELVGKAEALFRETSRLAVTMIEEALPKLPKEKDRTKRARALLEVGPFTTSYFAVAERVLPQLLRLLGEGGFEPAETLWRETLRSSAQQAWEAVLKGLGASPRALGANAKVWSRFQRLLNRYLPKTEGNEGGMM